jgi:glycosyltransferase involved in cell wall biosynthesis
MMIPTAKTRVVVRGPCLTQSGYGEHTRMILRALRTREENMDIFIVPVNWGQTGWKHEDTEERKWLDEKISLTQKAIQQKMQFDLSIQVAIPNEWEKLAPVNVGITAGIETTKVSPEWLQKANEMDKVIVVSNHSKELFENTTYDGQDQHGQPVTLKCTTPVDVVHFPVRNIEADMDFDLDLEYDFNYIFVGQWGVRKNADHMIKWWLEENWSEKVGLVLKVSHLKNNLYDKSHTHSRIKHILSNIMLDKSEMKCKIYLIHGDMTDEEMIAMYNHPKISCMISATHGEGFGLPLFEFALSGKPVAVTDWSGHLDFLIPPKSSGIKSKCFLPISYSLQPVQDQAVWNGVINKDTMWAYPHDGSFKQKIRQVRKNYSKWKGRAEKLKTQIEKNFDIDLINKKLIDAIPYNFDDDLDIVII